MTNCAADELGHDNLDSEFAPFIVPEGAFSDLTYADWERIMKAPIAYLPYRSCIPPTRVWPARVPLWSAP